MEEFRLMNGKVQRCSVFTQEQLSEIIPTTGWKRLGGGEQMLLEAGLSPAVGFFVVAGSKSDSLSAAGDVVAGLDVFREKDSSQGKIVAVYHYDIYKLEDEKFLMPLTPKKQYSAHHVKNLDEWEKIYDQQYAPHENLLDNKLFTKIKNNRT